MAKTLVLTFMADDRPGLVEKLSQAVTAGGGNWLESRMAHLAGKFAGVVRIEAAEDSAAKLRSALTALAADGFQLAIEESEPVAAPAGTLLHLDLVGPDQPGIVRDVSHCLAERGVSVEEMETELKPAPMGGEPLFAARAEVRVPADLDLGELRTALEALSAALMVDIGLSEGGD